MLEQVETIKTVFQEILGIPSDSDWDSVTYANTAGWDSVAHMALVSALENKFEVMLDTESVINMSSYPKAVEILAKHGVKV